MPGKVFFSLLLLSLLFVVMAPCANAQSATLEVKVGFAFFVGGAEFPAGDYTIQSADIKSPETLVIKNMQTHESKMFNTSQVTGEGSEGKARLLFHTIDGKQYLSQVWFAGYKWGRELLATKVVEVGKSNS
jgi:hypothetical protein